MSHHSHEKRYAREGLHRGPSRHRSSVRVEEVQEDEDVNNTSNQATFSSSRPIISHPEDESSHHFKFDTNNASTSSRYNSRWNTSAAERQHVDPTHQRFDAGPSFSASSSSSSSSRHRSSSLPRRGGASSSAFSSSPFGSSFFDNDPFFSSPFSMMQSSHQDLFSHMDNMMNSMFGNMRSLMHSSLHDFSQHARHASALTSPSPSNGGLTYVSSSSYVSTMGLDGKPVVKEQRMEKRIVDNIEEGAGMYRDSWGNEKLLLRKGLHDGTQTRAREVIQEKDARSGETRQLQNLHHLQPEQQEEFDREWEQRRNNVDPHRKILGNYQNYSQYQLSANNDIHRPRIHESNRHSYTGSDYLGNGHHTNVANPSPSNRLALPSSSPAHNVTSSNSTLNTNKAAFSSVTNLGSPKADPAPIKLNRNFRN